MSGWGDQNRFWNRFSLLALLLDGDHDLVGLVDEVSRRSEDSSGPGNKKKIYYKMPREGELHSTEVAYLLLTQQPRVQFPAFQKNLRGKMIKVAEVNQRHWLEESGQWLEYVD